MNGDGRTGRTTIARVLTILALGAAALGLVGAGFRARRAAWRPDAAMVGRWAGDARIVVSWTQRRTLPVRLDVDASGQATGVVGDARLVDGRLRLNRGWLGRVLHLRTDYIVVGRLDGAILADEGIRRAGVTLPLNWTGTTFEGGVHTSGWHVGDRRHMVLSAFDLVLRRAPVASR